MVDKGLFIFMSWPCKELRHQQPWYWSCSPRIQVFWFYHSEIDASQLLRHGNNILHLHFALAHSYNWYHTSLYWSHMNVMVSQITRNLNVCSTAFMLTIKTPSKLHIPGIHIPLTKGQSCRECFHFMMSSSCIYMYVYICIIITKGLKKKSFSPHNQALQAPLVLNDHVPSFCKFLRVSSSFLPPGKKRKYKN